MEPCYLTLTLSTRLRINKKAPNIGAFLFPRNNLFVDNTALGVIINLMNNFPGLNNTSPNPQKVTDDQGTKSVTGKDNVDHKIPMLLQLGGSVLIMSLGLLLFAVANIHGTMVKNMSGDNYAAVIAAVLIDQTNEERQESGLNMLVPSALLTASAQLKSDDMARGNYFAHTSPEGLSPWYWFEQAGYKFNYAGENLAVNFRDSGSVTRAWMNSPSHRANIANDNFTEIGIATASGRYKSRNTTFVTQHFGQPMTQDNGITINELVGRQVAPGEQVQAIHEAERLLAAASGIGFVDRLMVQPDKVYGTIFALIILLLSAYGVRVYYKVKDPHKRREILMYAGASILILILLGIATTVSLDSQVIAAVIPV